MSRTARAIGSRSSVATQVASMRSFAGAAWQASQAKWPAAQRAADSRGAPQRAHVMGRLAGR